MVFGRPVGRPKEGQPVAQPVTQQPTTQQQPIEDRFEVGQVATQTEQVIVDKQTGETFTGIEGIARLLSKVDRLETLL